MGLQQTTEPNETSPLGLICKLNSGLDCARCTGHGIAELQGFELVLAWILRLRCKGSFLLLWCSAFNFLLTLYCSSMFLYTLFVNLSPFEILFDRLKRCSV